MAVKTGTRPTKRQIEETEALLEPPEGDDLLDQEVVFRSRGANFYAVHVPERRWVEQGMNQTSPALSHEFAPNGEFRTRDKRVVDYLLSLQSYRREFWQVGDEVDAIPSSEPVIEKIMALALEFDDDGLVEIEKAEREGFERADVLAACAAARRQVQGMLSKEQAAA